MNSERSARQIWMERSERYPVFEISEVPMALQTSVEVPVEKVLEWQKAVLAWERAQQEMKEVFERAEKSKGFRGSRG